MMKYVFLLAITFCAGACTAVEPTDFAGGSAVELRDRDAIHGVVAAYEERVRLGLGSPFRVMEIAARDARLPEPDRAQLLTRLFSRVADGRTYEIGATLPQAHYRVIESAMTSARDPRAAELAVNLAYETAVRERSVTPELQYAASSTAALMRDRMLAQRDAQRVREIARTHNQQPHMLVPALRATRQLGVEQPAQAMLDAAAEAEAERLAAMLIGGVRQAARTRTLASKSARTSELSNDVARQILALPSAQPPQAALIVALRAAGLPFNAQNEEQFVAELALRTEDTRLAAQRAAIALRPFAQERVWYDGVAASTASDLFSRHGVQVVFDVDVPGEWHDYYRFVLADALADMQRVLPGLSLKGLTIEIGDVDAAANHLAYHDPQRRVIRWAPRTGSGSLAHEIAHDLDWQIARRSYRKSGYASDVATDVAAMVLLTRGEDESERPRETFARQLDWIIASTLASQGRTNGHLSSVQHDWLPGYGSARPPAANVQSANALAGMVVRAAKLGPTVRDQIEAAVLSPDIPKGVQTARRTRATTKDVAGPRIPAKWPLPLNASIGFHFQLSRNEGSQGE